MNNFIIEIIRKEESCQQYQPEEYFGEIMQEIVNVLKDSMISKLTAHDSIFFFL